MRQIDLTDRIEKRKGSRVTYSTVYLNGMYVGFASSVGISFAKALKRGGIRSHKNGTARWYFGSDNSLTRAVSNARRVYGISLPVNGWEKARIKTYNTTDTEEVVLNLIK